MSHPLPRLPRLLLWPLLLAWLIALPALGASLNTDKMEITLGEEAVVSIAGKPFIAVVTDWSVGDGLEILDRDSDRAKVKGTKMGSALVKVKINGKSYKTTIKILEGGDKKNDPRGIKIEGLVRALGVPDVQTRIARLLYEVTNEIRSAESFYAELRKLGGKMTDVIELRSKLVDMPDSSLARQVMGPLYPEGGSLVEQRILTWRKQQTLAAIETVLNRFASRTPAEGAKLIVSHVGKWADEDARSLKFPGDIDFSFVSTDAALVDELKAAFLQEIVRRTQLDQYSLDSVATAHGKAGLEVYIGRHGMAYAELEMKINFIIDLEKGTSKPSDIEEVAKILASERTMLASMGKEITQPEWNKEPGLSMEMVRHFDHDIAKTGIYDIATAVVKAAKYLDRSYTALKDVKGTPNDPKLAEFAMEITALAKAKPQSSEIRKKMVQRISEFFGTEPRVEFDGNTQTLRLALDASQIADFHKKATKAIWKTVEQGSKTRTDEMDTRLRALLDRQRKGEKLDEDVAKLREDMKNLVDMVEAEVKAIHGDMDIPVTVLTNNAKVRGMLNTLSQRFNLKALSPEELKEKKFVEELLKAQTERPNLSRGEMLKAYIMERTALAAELSMKGVEKTNQMLDFIDDGLLGTLRGDAEFADFEAEMKNIRQASIDPTSKQESASRLTVLKGKAANGIKTANQKINGALQATAAGRQGMKFMAVYGLVDEMQAYRDVFNDQGWEGFATEFFRRRVPLGSAVENAIMGNTYLATWDVITTLVPPLGLYDAAKGLGTSIGNTAQSTYWSEQLSLFVDTLYVGAKFELQSVESTGNTKIGVYRLVSVKHPRGGTINLSAFAKQRQEEIKELNRQLKTPRFKGGGINWAAYKTTFNGLTEWTETDTILKRNLAASDPVLTLLEAMANHPDVGPRLMAGLAEKGLVRWEEVKLGFITNLIISLEERRQADQALGAGQLPDLFSELRKTAAELEIEEAMLRGLDAEVDTSNLKTLVNWLWDTKRSVLSQAPKESETLRAAQVVKKYLDSYKAILKTRNEVAGAISAAAAGDGGTRYLTGDLFLSGRADPDVKAADAWVKYAAAARNTSSEALLVIKKKFLPKAGLDAEDEKFLERVFPHELWIKPYKDAGVARTKTWLIDRAIAHGKERNAILDEYKAWLEKQAPVQLTVTLLDALDAKHQVSGASGNLRPTDELGKSGAGQVAGNQLVFGVPSGRYRLTIKAPGYTDAGQDILLGRALDPAPKLTLSLTPTDKKGDNDLAAIIAAALQAHDWKRLADRLDAEKKSDLKMRNATAWQANIDALTKALDTLKAERMAWALAAEEYINALDNIDSSVWEKLMRGVEQKRQEAEERCYKDSSSSEDSNKRLARCQKEGQNFEKSCIGTWPDQHWEEKTRIRVAKQEVPEQVHTLHSAGYFTHRAWFEAVEKLAEKYKLPFPFPKPVLPRLKYAASCASVDLPGGAKKQEGVSAFKVTVEAPSASLPFGKSVTLNTSASGGKSPYRYVWSSGASGNRVSMTPRWAGEWTVTVTATDADGKIGEGQATLRVSPLQVKMLGTKPQVFYGSQATLSLPGKESPPPAPDPCIGKPRSSNPYDECNTIKVGQSIAVSPGYIPPPPDLISDPSQAQALPETGPAPRAGTQRVVWQAEPAIGFAPPTSDDGRTRVTYSRMGQVKLWCEILEEVEGAFHTVGECDHETINVIAPKFGVSFTPPEDQGHIGQDIRLRINSEPSVTDDLIDFRWFDPATSNRLELPPNAREISFKVKDAKPVVFKALARVPHHGDSIAEIGATYTGLQFEVKAWAVEPGTRPMMWDAKKGGLVPVPKGSYATHERIPLRAEIQGSAPSGLRWNWTVNDGTTISNPISQTPTVSRSSTGSIEAHVEARDAEGTVLGSGDVNLSVIEVRDTPPLLANPTVSLAATKDTVERGQAVSFSANATGGKPPYRYAWKGTSGQGAQATLTPTKSGSQTVSVTVTDSKDKTGTASVILNVTASTLDIAKDKAGKLSAQATQQAKAGDLAGAAKTIEDARQQDGETARPVATKIRDQAKKAASEAEKIRDFKTSGNLFEAAKRADPSDQEAHIGANNTIGYQQRQDGMLAKQRELAGDISRGDWHLAETHQTELKIMDEGLPGGLTPQTRDLIKRYEDGKAAYIRKVETKRKEIAAEVKAGRYDNARRKLSELRQTNLIPADEDWSRKVEEHIDKVEAESKARGGSGKPGNPAASNPPLGNVEPLVTGTYSGPGVQVRTGNYGHNCGTRFGNVTRHLAAACDGKARCEYTIDYTQIGDPVPGCAKDYVAVWKCPNDATWYATNAAPEAGFGKKILLQCPGNPATALPPGSTFTGGSQDGNGYYPVDLSSFGGKKGTPSTVNNVSIDDGPWKINANGYTGKLELNESGGRLSGRVWFDAHQVWEDLREISFDGRTLRFLRPGPNQRYTGTLAGNEVRGTFDGGGTWNWVITRDSASAAAPPAQISRPASAKLVLEDDKGPYSWIEKTAVQKEVVAHGQAAFRSTGNNHFAGTDLGVVGDYPEQFRSLNFWLFPTGPEADIQIQVQVDGVWGKRWGYDAGPKYNGYDSAMEGTTTGLKPGQWQEVTLDLLSQLRINPGQRITGMAFSSDNGDVYYDSVYLQPNPNPARKPGFQPVGRLVLEDGLETYNWIERSEVENYLVFNGAKAFRSTGNNHFLADLGAAGSGPGQFRHLNFWAFFMGAEADIQVQIQVNGSWDKRWGYDAGPVYNGYGWPMEGTTTRMTNGRWVQIQLDLIGQLHLKPGDKITGLAFSSDNADVFYDSVYLLPSGVTPGVGTGFQGGETGGRDYTYAPPIQGSYPPTSGGRDYSSLSPTTGTSPLPATTGKQAPGLLEQIDQLKGSWKDLKGLFGK